MRLPKESNQSLTSSMDLHHRSLSRSQLSVYVLINPGGILTRSTSEDSLLNMAIPLAPHSIFDGRYKIQSLLGTGGMGAVYLALDLELNRSVAIKLLTMYPNKRNTDEDLERFHREGKALSRLIHPNIISVFRLGFWQSSYPYLVMEYFENGESLSSFIRREGSIPWTKAISIVLNVCDGLIAAHSHGIAHRDIKPQNVLVSADLKTIKIIDFGLCSIQAQSSDEQLKLTQTGNLLGTAAYMAPEIARGEKITTAVDIYSLACVLFELLTEHQLFDQVYDVPGLVFLHCNSKAPTLKEKCPQINWPGQLENTLKSGLAKHAKDRPTAQAFREQLQEVLTEYPVEPSSTSKYFKSKTIVILIATATFIAATVMTFSGRMRPSSVETSWKTQKHDSAYALLVKSDLILRNGEGIKAYMDCLKKLLKLPDHRNELEKAEALNRLSSQCLNLEQYDEALKYATMMEPLCKKLSGENRNKLMLRYIDDSTAALAKLGRNEEQIRACKAGIELAMDLPLDSIARAEDLGTFYKRLSDAYSLAGNYTASEECLNKGIATIEKYAVDNVQWSERYNALYLQRIEFLLAKKNSDALEKEIAHQEFVIYKTCANTDAWRRAYCSLIERLVNKGEFPLALKHISKFKSEFQPSKTSTLSGSFSYYEFIIFFQTHELKKSIEAGKTAVSILSRSDSEGAAMTLTELGGFALSAKLDQIGEDALVNARRIFAAPQNALSPDRYRPSRELGMYYLSIKEMDKAKTYLTEARELVSRNCDPSSPANKKVDDALLSFAEETRKN